MPSKARPPAAPRLGDLTARGLSSYDVVDDLLIRDAAIDDGFAEQAAADFAELSGVRFRGGTLAGSQWYRGRWVDTELAATDLANAVFTEGGWERVAASGVRATGLQLAAARLTDVSFESCGLSLLNVRGATLRRVRLVDCDLTDSQWADARLSDVELVRCRLRSAELGAVGRLERVRLTDCALEGVSGLSRLRGVVIAGGDPVVVAGLLARELGITLSVT